MINTKIAIIGTGAVGSTIAYALILKDLPVDITIIDVDEQRCRGEFLDLSDALPFCNGSTINQGLINDAKNADIIVIAAGKKQEPGQDRIALLKTNKKIIETIMKDIQPLAPHAIIIMVTNPVDSLTYYAQQCTKLPRNQIIGSGTFLDTQRLRYLLSKKLDLAEQSIHAYILGEHGDTQFVAWSAAQVAGTPLTQLEITSHELNKIAQTTKDKAYEIIACKGSTYYGIGTCIMALCRTIIFDQKKVTPVSCFIQEYDVCMSMPVILGKNGIEHILPIPLNDHEKKLFEHSAQTLRKYLG